MGGGDGATRVERFIDRELETELADGEVILARAYLRDPTLIAKSKGSNVLVARVFGLLGLGLFRARRGPRVAYFGALTDRRLLLIETRQSAVGPRLVRRHLFSYGRGDIRMRFTAREMRLETRDGATFRWAIELDGEHTRTQREFFDALAGQAGVALPA